ncbi:MAG: phage portal protein [Planctomycetes bacterium]|nr:phage portal protein [Planctomycetota bacterium]
MSIIDTLFERFGYKNVQQFNALVEQATKAELENVHNWLGETADAQRWDMPGIEVFANQADMYRLNSNLGSAVDILSRDVSTAAFNVQRRVGEEVREIPNHPLEELLMFPNPLDSKLEFITDTVSNYLLNGNSVWWLNKADKHEKPVEIWPIPYEMLEPVPDKYSYISHYAYYPGMGKPPIRFETWEIVHFKTFNPHNRFFGLSPLESLAVTLRGDMAMRRTNKDAYTDHGGAPASVFAFKDFPSNEAWADIQQEVKSAAKRNEMIMLRGIGEGLTWLQRSMSSKDMDYVSILEQNTTDIFNRICPGLLGMLAKNVNVATADAARVTYSEKTLWPMMETIAQKVTSDILPAYGRKLKGAFDDPRVVDRNLEMAEQDTYGKTHTIAETREKYYGDNPLGDERDDMLVVEVRTKAAASAFNRGGDEGDEGEEEQGEPFENEEKPAEDETGRLEKDDLSMKAIVDLKKWRTMALQKAAKAEYFQSDVIPAGLLMTVKADLKAVKNKGEIAQVFNKAIEQMKPKPKANPADILRGIELGVRAIEAEK